MPQTKSITSYNRQLFESMTPEVADQYELVATAPMVGILPIGAPISSRLHSWVEDVAYTLTSALSAGVSAGATTWNVTTGTGVQFTKGDLILASSEIVRVTAISSNALTVDRAEQGTSAAAQTTTTTLYIIGNSQLEGADAVTGTYTTRVTRTNYCQIFQTPFTITGTDAAVAGPGGDQTEYEMRRQRMLHLEKLDRAIAYNYNAGTGSATVNRYMAGLKGLLSSYTYAITSSTIGGTTTSTAISKAKLDTFLKLRHTQGGRNWIAFCGRTAYGSMQDMFAANDQAPISRNGAAAARFGFYFAEYLCAWGLVTLVLDHNLREGDAYFIESSDARRTGVIMRFVTERQAVLQTLAKTGDADKYQYVSEMTLEVHIPAVHGIITGIVTGG